MKYIYGPVPSRRLGLSLGISPIPKKTCNYSCIYCQLGRTSHLTNTRKMFFPLAEIVAELDRVLADKPQFDVVTIVGEGEPTLYLGLGELIDQVKQRVEKPVAVISNGALVFSSAVQSELSRADIALLSLDAWDEASFRQVNRPYGTLDFSAVYNGLKHFASQYQGQLWLEIMLMDGINDDLAALNNFAALLKDLKYDRLYLNTPVRPPAETAVKAISRQKMEQALAVLGGISIDLLHSQGFQSNIADHYTAILSIIKRHPMNQFEIEGFLHSRGYEDIKTIFSRLQADEAVDVISYKGYDTYRLK